MDEQTLRLLNVEIAEGFEALSSLAVGSDEYKTAVESLVKLIDRQTEMEKNIVENENKVNAQKKENDLKRKQLRDETVDRWIKNGLTAFSICSGLALAVWGTRASFEFEKTGSITTIIGRKFISELIRKR